jgi:hypothetical protein
MMHAVRKDSIGERRTFYDGRKRRSQNSEHRTQNEKPSQQNPERRTQHAARKNQSVDDRIVVLISEESLDCVSFDENMFKFM